MTTNPLDHAYWEALGIKPIVVDTSNPESIENAKSEITARIVEAVKEIKSTDSGKGGSDEQS